MRRSAASRTRTRCCRAWSCSRSRCSPRSGAGNRLRRRRALSLVIGWFAGLVLSGAWANKEVFWWPAFGFERPDAPLLPPWPVVVVLELLGLAAAAVDLDAVRPRRPGPARAICCAPGTSASSVRGRPTDDRVRAARADRRQPRRPVPRPHRPAAHRRRPRASRARRRAVRDDAGSRASSRARCTRAVDDRASDRRDARLAIETDERLVELDYGEWDERGARRRHAGRVGALARRSRRSRRPAASHSSHVDARVGRVLRRARRATSSIVAVSHVSPIKAAVCWALGVDARGDLAHVPRPRVGHADRPAGATDRRTSPRSTRPRRTISPR